MIINALRRRFAAIFAVILALAIITAGSVYIGETRSQDRAACYWMVKFTPYGQLWDYYCNGHFVGGGGDF